MMGSEITSASNKLLTHAALRCRTLTGTYWDDRNYGLRLSTRAGKREAGLWFRTSGCTYQRTGHCTMCNYGGVAHSVTAYEMVAAVREGLTEIPEDLDHLLVSPIGSFFDAREVPIQARQGVVNLLSHCGVPSLAVESRAETLDEEVVGWFSEALKEQQLKVYVGLESADPWVLRNCLNKGLSLKAVRRAFECLAMYEVSRTANILVGAPFLSHTQILEDVIRSVEWALEHGATECSLFPVHVKAGTVLSWLQRRGLYEPPSLWALVDILNHLRDLLPTNRITFSWHRTYGATNILRAATTCARCAADVLMLLDRLYETSDGDILDSLLKVECTCIDEWRRHCEETGRNSAVDIAEEAYDALGCELIGKEWWQERKSDVLAELRGEAR